MSSLEEKELINTLPKDGPSLEEIKKYLDKYNDEFIVIKCGGSVLIDPNLFNIFIKDVAVLKKLGLCPIIVHGGGKRINNKLSELNIKSTFIKGLRVTDDKTISIVGDVLMMIRQPTLMETVVQIGMMPMNLKAVMVVVAAMIRMISTQHHSVVHVVEVLVEKLQSALTLYWKPEVMIMQ